MSKTAIIDPKFEAMRTRWYREENILFALQETFKFREGVFIRLATDELPTTTIRNCKMNAVRYIRMNFDRFRIVGHNHPYQFYASLAKFPNMESFSFNREKRREQQDEFNATYLQQIVSYDFLFDIDNSDLRIAYANTYKTKQIFDANKIPYTLTFSGNKGFHIRVEYDDFGEELKALSFLDLITVLKQFAENFRIINGLWSIDLSIFNGRRIFKTPYSICYNDYFIALPLSDEQMDAFTLPMCSMVYWLKPENMKRLFKRGMLKRDGKPEAFGELVQKYSKL